MGSAQHQECCPREMEPTKLNAKENPVSPQHCDPIWPTSARTSQTSTTLSHQAKELTFRSCPASSLERSCHASWGWRETQVTKRKDFLTLPGVQGCSRHPLERLSSLSLGAYKLLLRRHLGTFGSKCKSPRFL